MLSLGKYFFFPPPSCHHSVFFFSCLSLSLVLYIQFNFYLFHLYLFILYSFIYLLEMIKVFLITYYLMFGFFLSLSLCFCTNSFSLYSLQMSWHIKQKNIILSNSFKHFCQQNLLKISCLHATFFFSLNNLGLFRMDTKSNFGNVFPITQFNLRAQCNGELSQKCSAYTVEYIL